MAAAAKKKTPTNWGRIVLITLAIIGGWTVVDNTYRLGRALQHTVTHFTFTAPHVVSAK
jgi:hypothetical protein